MLYRGVPNLWGLGLVVLTGCLPTPQIPLGSCGANLHGDDELTCKNGAVDVGELCLEAVDSRPISSFMYGNNNLSLADFNGDEHLDLRIGSDIYAGHGDGTFAATYMRPGVGVGTDKVYAAEDCAEGDFNGDGITDLAYIYKRIEVYHEDGHRTLTIWFGNEKLDYAPSEYHSDLLRMYPLRVSAGDINEDGLDDLLIPTRDWDLVFCDTEILIRKEDTFADGGWYSGGGYGATSCIGPLMVDLNGDGHLDIDPATLRVLLGDGKGAFVDKRLYPRPVVTAVYGQDLDCDKTPDAVDLDDEGSIRAWRNLGKAEFELVTPAISTGEALMGLADLNGDAEPDVIAAGPAGLRVIFGDADFTFSGLKQLSLESAYTELEVGDLNEDGQLDLVALGPETAQIFLSRP